MPDREKIMQGIFAHTGRNKASRPCLSCPYDGDAGCFTALLEDVLPLLKEQEPRVLTDGEVLHSIEKPLWFESRGVYLSRKGFWCLLFEVDQELHIRIVQSVTGGKITLSLIDYGKTWRCWTSRPTDEQREAVKWDD